MTTQVFIPLVEADPFDLSSESASGPTDYSSSQLPETLGDKGSLLEDYHFRTGYTELAGSEPENTPNHEVIPKVLDRINRVKDKILQTAEQNGVSTNMLTYALNETIQNATKYGGAETAGDPKLIYLSWEIENYGDRRGMTISVGNPAREIFDPSRYLVMKFDEIAELLMTDGAMGGHLGLTYLMGACERCDYAWHLQDGSEIHLSMQPGPQDVADMNPELSDMRVPMYRKATLIDSTGDYLPYSLEQFAADVSSGRAARSLVLKFFVPFGTQDVPA